MAVQVSDVALGQEGLRGVRELDRVGGRQYLDGAPLDAAVTAVVLDVGDRYFGQGRALSWANRPGWLSLTTSR